MIKWKKCKNKKYKDTKSMTKLTNIQRASFI